MSLQNTSWGKPRCHLQPLPGPPANKAMLLWRTFSTPSSYTLPQTHPNTSSARSSTRPQVTCSNIDISSNRTNTERCGNTALQTNWDDCFKGYATYLAQTPVFFIRKVQVPNTNTPHTDALSAMSGHKRMRSIALNSRWAAISSTSPATKVHPRQTSSPPNYSSIQQKAHLAPCSLAST